MDSISYAVFIPTLNAEKYLSPLLATLNINNSFFIDSSSNDKTLEILLNGGWKVISIDKKTFNHGETRNLCLKLCDHDFVIFMTQDALPKDSNPFLELLKPFKDSSVAATYAKQLPRKGAGTLEQLDRTFKYPDYPIVQSLETLEKLGSTRTYFLSNSCAAYRMSVFRELGGFPDAVILSEDESYAYKVIQNGYKVIYTPSAQVYHSHNYSLRQSFQRYFDIGTYRANSNLVRSDSTKQDFGQGYCYLQYCVKEVIARKEYFLLLKLLVNIAVSFLGYSLGTHYKMIPNRVRKVLSMHTYYWSRTQVKL